MSAAGSPSARSMDLQQSGQIKPGKSSLWSPSHVGSNLPAARASIPVGAGPGIKTSASPSPNMPTRAMSEGLVQGSGPMSEHNSQQQPMKIGRQLDLAQSPFPAAHYKSPNPGPISPAGDLQIGPQPFNPNTILQSSSSWSANSKSKSLPGSNKDEDILQASDIQYSLRLFSHLGFRWLAWFQHTHYQQRQITDLDSRPYQCIVCHKKAII